MTPFELYELAADALTAVGEPEWPSSEHDDRIERLTLLAGEDDAEPCWAILSEPSGLAAVAGEPACSLGISASQPPLKGVSGELGQVSGLEMPFGVEAVAQAEGPSDVNPEDHVHSDCCGHDHLHDDNEELIAWPVDVEIASRLLANHFRSCLAATGWQVQLTVSGGVRRWRLADCLSFADGGGDRLEGEYPFGSEELPTLCASTVAIQSSRISRPMPEATRR